MHLEESTSEWQIRSDSKAHKADVCQHHEKERGRILLFPEADLPWTCSGKEIELESSKAALKKSSNRCWQCQRKRKCPLSSSPWARQWMISGRKQLPDSSLIKLFLSGFHQTSLGFFATACRNRSTATLQRLHVCRIVGKLAIALSFHFSLCARKRLVYKGLVSLKIYLKSLLFLFLVKLLGFGLWNHLCLLLGSSLQQSLGCSTATSWLTLGTRSQSVSLLVTVDDNENLKKSMQAWRFSLRLYSLNPQRCWFSEKQLSDWMEIGGFFWKFRTRVKQINKCCRLEHFNWCQNKPRQML